MNCFTSGLTDRHPVEKNGPWRIMSNIQMSLPKHCTCCAIFRKGLKNVLLHGRTGKWYFGKESDAETEAEIEVPAEAPESSEGLKIMSGTVQSSFNIQCVRKIVSVHEYCQPQSVANPPAPAQGCVQQMISGNPI